MLGEEPPNPAEPCHSHPPGSPFKALPVFRASPESRPPTKKWSGSGGAVIYIHSQARGSGHPRGTGSRVGGQGPGVLARMWSSSRDWAWAGSGALQNPLWPVGKGGSPWWSPKPTLVPVAWADAGPAGAGGRPPVVGASESQRPGRLRARQHPGRDPAGGRPPGAGEGRSALSHYGRQGRGEVAKDPARTPPCGD